MGPVAITERLRVDPRVRNAAIRYVGLVAITERRRVDPRVRNAAIRYVGPVAITERRRVDPRVRNAVVNGPKKALCNVSFFLVELMLGQEARRQALSLGPRQVPLPWCG